MGYRKYILIVILQFMYYPLLLQMHLFCYFYTCTIFYVPTKMECTDHLCVECTLGVNDACHVCICCWKPLG